MILYAMPCAGPAVQSHSVSSTAPAMRRLNAKCAVPTPQQLTAVRAAPPVRLSARSRITHARTVRFSAKHPTAVGSVARATVYNRVVNSHANSRPVLLSNLPQLIAFRCFNSDKHSPTTRLDHASDRHRDWPALSSVHEPVPAGPGCKCADQQ